MLFDAEKFIDRENRICGECDFFEEPEDDVNGSTGFCQCNPPKVIKDQRFGVYPLMKAFSPGCGRFAPYGMADERYADFADDAQAKAEAVRVASEQAAKALPAGQVAGSPAGNVPADPPAVNSPKPAGKPAGKGKSKKN